MLDRFIMLLKVKLFTKFPLRPNAREWSSSQRDGSYLFYTELQSLTSLQSRKLFNVHREGESKKVIIISLFKQLAWQKKSQHQRFTSIIHSYCNMPCLDCIKFRFSTAVVNDKILQVSIYTFLTLSIYKVYCLIQVFP